MSKVLYTVHRHKRNASATELYTKDMFTYTPQDRLDTQTHQIRINGPVQLISKNEYDALGQLVRKSVGGTDATGQTALQKVDYSYNIRGWLKEINKVDNLLQGTDPADLFAFKINYDSKEIANANVSGLYNGNISETFWRTNSDNIKRSYGYQYDALNRLDKAFYAKNNTITNAYNEDVSYDKNGNITRLERTGARDAAAGMWIDELHYQYPATNPNQLEGVSDATTHPEGFKGNSFANHQTYTYDPNGNMITDNNKDIINISYNHLNLPVTITFGNGNKIDYLYDAGGKKCKKTILQSGVELYTEYMDGFHYFNAELQFFPTAEGYIRRTFTRRGNVDSYVFNYVDHLGNIRISFAENPTGKALTIIEENHYYPFGLKHKNYNQTKYAFEEHPINPGVILEPSPLDMDLAYNYKYNGKELQDELGLNLYDYGARNYDPAIGRWMNIDPLAETSRRWSPYTYCYNNPMRFVDPDGMEADDVIFRSIGGSQNGANSKRAFGKTESVINDGLGGNYASIGKDGKLSLNVNREDLSTDEQKGFYDVLNTAMTAEKDVKIDIVESDNFIMGGSMQKHNANAPGIVDIDDVIAFGTGELMNSTSTFAHEVAETYEKQINGNTDYINAEGTGAHQLANIAESTTNGGWVPGVSKTTNYSAKPKAFRGGPGQLTKQGIVQSGTLTTPLTRNGVTKYFTYQVIEGNVVKQP